MNCCALDQVLRTGTSREHHLSLVVCKRIEACNGNVDALAAMCEFVLQCYTVELLPHFQHEEECIFPALLGTYDIQMQRAFDEHATLHALAKRVSLGDVAALMAFGELLARHVSFEDKELFPLYRELVRKRTQAANE